MPLTKLDRHKMIALLEKCRKGDKTKKTPHLDKAIEMLSKKEHVSMQDIIGEINLSVLEKTKKKKAVNDLLSMPIL